MEHFIKCLALAHRLSGGKLLDCSLVGGGLRLLLPDCYFFFTFLTSVHHTHTVSITISLYPAFVDLVPLGGDAEQ